MIAAVGSTNPVKIDSASLAFNRIWPDTEWTIKGCLVESGAPGQPLTDDETIRGAQNRATAALRCLNVDYGVGIEGGLQKTGSRWFAGVWVVVVDRKGREGIGAGLKVAVPSKLIDLIQEGAELGDACDQVFMRQNSRQNEGIFGLLTNGNLSRTTVTTDAIIGALAVFLHPSAD